MNGPARGDGRGGKDVGEERSEGGEASGNDTDGELDRSPDCVADVGPGEVALVHGEKGVKTDYAGNADAEFC